MARATVLITGASTGIGRATARYLVERGWEVFAGVRKEADAEGLRREVPQALHPVLLDVRKADQIAAAVEQVAAIAGDRGLNALVNNAGVAFGGPLEFFPIEALRTQLEVNVIGAVAVTQAFLPLLRRGKGRIVNVSSVAGRVPSPFLGPYAASKHALEALSDALRGELRPWRIPVVLVEPGPVATPIWEKAQRGADRLLERLPPRALELYGPVLERMRGYMEASARRGIPPEAVAAVIHRALTAPNPKARYPVGPRVGLQIWVRKLLPDGLWDRLVARQLGWG